MNEPKTLYEVLAPHVEHAIKMNKPDEFLEDKIDVLEQEVAQLKAKLLAEELKIKKIYKLELENKIFRADIEQKNDRLEEAYRRSCRLAAIVKYIRNSMDEDLELLQEIELASSSVLYAVQEALGKTSISEIFGDLELHYKLYSAEKDGE